MAPHRRRQALCRLRVQKVLAVSDRILNSPLSYFLPLSEYYCMMCATELIGLAPIQRSAEEMRTLQFVHTTTP